MIVDSLVMFFASHQFIELLVYTTSLDETMQSSMYSIRYESTDLIVS